MAAGKFEVYPTKGGQFRFRLRSSAGMLVATSSVSFESRSEAHDACTQVTQAVNGNATMIEDVGEDA